MSQLSGDCVYEIFELLKKDRITLHSCLLVNRLWCEVSVRILWRRLGDYSTSNYSTLIACLPNESKKILYNNGINILTPTSKPPLFNYPSFCKDLTTRLVTHKIEQLLKDQQISPQNSLKNIYMVTREIYKLLMSQIPTLKILDLNPPSFGVNIQDHIVFTSYPGAKDCLKDISKFHCSSHTNPEFFYQLSKICRNIQSLSISFEKVISGLTDLISVQKNLKYLIISQYDYRENMEYMFPLLAILPNTLIKLEINGGSTYMQMSFITNLANLQELALLFDDAYAIEDFKKLQHITFPQLQILKIKNACPRYDLLIKFLECNGQNLKKLIVGDYSGDSDHSLNLAIAKFCPNLRKLSSGFKNDELETLKMIFNSCQYLESIRMWCGHYGFLSEKVALEMVKKYSPKSLYELILHYQDFVEQELLPEELESFFVSWRNRKPLYLIINNYGENSLDRNDENMKIIEKYFELGVVKKFEILQFFESKILMM